MHQEYRRYWWEIGYTQHLRGKLVKEMHKCMRIKMAWHSLKYHHCAILTYTRVSVNSAGWLQLGMVWKGYGDQTKVNKHSHLLLLCMYKLLVGCIYVRGRSTVCLCIVYMCSAKSTRVVLSGDCCTDNSVQHRATAFAYMC